MNKNWSLLVILSCFLLFSSALVSGLISISCNPSSGESGTTVTVPVRVQDSPYMEAWGLDLFYDTNMFTLQNVVRGTLTQDWGAFGSNENPPGKVMIGAARFSGTPIPAGSSGTIAIATLNVTCGGCNDGDQSDVYIDNYIDHISSMTPEPATTTFTFSTNGDSDKCLEAGKVWCTEDRCNIGHHSCNPNPPPKEYTVPNGEKCTFTGSIANSGCAWQNPATLSVSGNACSQETKYYNCGIRHFSFTCYEGDVSLSSDDSAYFTLTYTCEDIPPECGNGVVEQGEECEPPYPKYGYDNNQYCSQSTSTCDGKKYGTRDGKGYCDSACSCIEDSYYYYCSLGKCSAECDSDDDCDDGDSSTNDYCKNDCMCAHDKEPEKCGNWVVEEGEECEPPYPKYGYDNNQYCSQSTNTCDGKKYGTRDGKGYCDTVCSCSEDAYYYYCSLGKCSAECDSDDDCDDGSSSTYDFCEDDCTCTHDVKPPVCGNGIVEQGEECDGDHSQCDDGDPDTTDICKSNCECENNPIPGYCGNGVLEQGEECERPGTTNNHYCSQNPSTCDGKKYGIRDGFGDCDYRCDCSLDNFIYSCVLGECSAECDSDDDCDDGNSTTNDYCENDCTCSYDYTPSCGNGVIDPGEECEDDADCAAGEKCDNCKCVSGPYCGDGTINQNEECDDGLYNGLGCNPGKNQSCFYCDENCTLVEVGPGSCGDGNIDAYEQCDAGADNGNACSPDCDRSCFYCDDNCSVIWVIGDACSGDVPFDPYVPYLPPFPYYGGMGGYGYGRARPAVCGNGVIEIGEECDDGNSNGALCSARCGGSCTYCTDTCNEAVLSGSPCLRTPRPWETGMIGHYCENMGIVPVHAHLDNVCGSHGEVVTSQVSRADNMYAKQDACDEGNTYIYLYFGDVRKAGVLRESSVTVEHKEYLTKTWLEFYEDNQWKRLCELPVNRIDNDDTCGLEDVEFDNVSMRMGIKSTAPNSFEMLDHAYLNLTYCFSPNVVCGNGIAEGTEECDDGNLVGGDGCNQICKLEYWLCSDWDACVDGEQAQTCIYGREIKVNKKLCERKDYSMLLFLIIVLVLIAVLFFLPYLYVVFVKKREKEEK